MPRIQRLPMSTHAAPDLDPEAEASKAATIANFRRQAAERKLKRQQEHQEAAILAEQTISNETAPSEPSTPSQDSPQSESSSSPSEPASKTKWNFSLSYEIQALKEFANKFSGPRRERRRVAEDIEETKRRWAEGELLKRKKAPDPSKIKKEEVDVDAMNPEEKAAYEAALAQEAEEQARINATPLMHVGDNETVWEKRFTAAKERWRKTWIISGVRKLRREAAVSENPLVSKARNLKEDFADNLNDIKDFYGTTQHPLIGGLRDGVDNVTGETETGWAIGQIRRVDPGFDIQLFLEDMEDYMIPLVIEAFLKGDMAVMASVMEDKAHGGAFSSCREREVLGHYWDSRILNVDHLDFQGATVENEIPYVTLSFVCQHVHCVKDKKGTIVEGHPGEVKSVYYAWKLRRDLDNPDFDWKIVEMHYQRIFSLVG